MYLWLSKRSDRFYFGGSGDVPSLLDMVSSVWRRLATSSKRPRPRPSAVAEDAEPALPFEVTGEEGRESEVMGNH